MRSLACGWGCGDSHRAHTAGRLKETVGGQVGVPGMEDSSARAPPGAAPPAALIRLPTPTLGLRRVGTSSDERATGWRAEGLEVHGTSRATSAPTRAATPASVGAGASGWWVGIRQRSPAASDRGRVVGSARSLLRRSAGDGKQSEAGSAGGSGEGGAGCPWRVTCCCIGARILVGSGVSCRGDKSCIAGCAWIGDQRSSRQSRRLGASAESVEWRFT